MTEPVVHSSKGCVDCPSEAARTFRAWQEVVGSAPLLLFSQILNRSMLCNQHLFFLNVGIFCNSCSVALCKCAPCRLVEECPIQLEISARLEIRELPSPSWRLWAEGIGWMGLLGVKPHVPPLTIEVSPVSPRQLGHVLPLFVTSLLRSATDIGVYVSRVRPASLAIFPLVRSCFHSSLAGRWFGFRCPDAFTQWCFGCSRGKQVSVLCFYYFPD